MPPKPLNKTALRRLLEIDRLLRSGAGPTTEELALRFCVTERTIYRDLAYLRDQLNAPLAYSRAGDYGGGYRYTNPAYLLPANFLRRAEVTGALLAGRLAAQHPGQPRSADFAGLLERLKDLVDSQELSVIENEASAFDYAARRVWRVDPRIVEAAGAALRRRHRIQADLFLPGGGDEEAAGGNWHRFTFEIYRICNLDGAWYILGREVESDERKAIPLARLKRFGELPERYGVPPDFSLADALADAFGFKLERSGHRVQLLFRGRAAHQVAEREWHPSQRIAFRPDGTLRLTLRTANLAELARWLAGFPGEVLVEAPEELRLLVCENARKLLADHERSLP
ncbi:MAG TPA: WYL domain-containing transcriptional regulator [Candidatus Coatesbacteria bacterium]|nr:WYL domain-containing transcriptional regulator [Candidatus Coatesbacteria bacterium]